MLQLLGLVLKFIVGVSDWVSLAPKTAPSQRFSNHFQPPFLICLGSLSYFQKVSE